MLRSLQHLLPRGQAWKTHYDTHLRRWVEGFGAFASEVRAFLDAVYDDLDAERTRQLVAWERELGLPAHGLEAQRRARLGFELAAGGQDPKSVHDAARVTGADVCLHEWWTDDERPRTPYDPSRVAQQPLLGDFQCDAVTATQPQCRSRASSTLEDPQTQCTRFLSNEPLYLVNNAASRDAPPALPSSSALWPHFLYWSGSRYAREVPALVDASLRTEIERTLLRTKPATAWVVANVQYVQAPEWLSETGVLRWSSQGLVEGALATWAPTRGVVPLLAEGTEPEVRSRAFGSHPGVATGPESVARTTDPVALGAFRSGEFSFAVCARLGVRSEGARLLDVRGPDDTDRVRLQLLPSGELRVVLIQADEAVFDIVFVQDMFEDAYTHTIAFTYDHGAAVLYLDGAQVKTRNNPEVDLSDAAELTVGGELGEPLTAEAIVVPRALELAEVESLSVYCQQLYADSVEQAGPLERWRSAGLSPGPLQQWPGELGRSTPVASAFMTGAFPKVEANAFGDLPGVSFRSGIFWEEPVDADDTLTAPLGSSFSVAWFGEQLGGEVVVADFPSGFTSVGIAADGRVAMEHPDGDLEVSGLWDVVSPDLPHAFVATYDSPTHTLTVVVDGQLVGSDTGGAASELTGDAALFLVGGFGLLSDLALYEGALDEATAVAVSQAMARANGSCALAALEAEDMSFEYNQIKAVSVRPPRRGEVYRFAVSTTPDAVYLPGASAAALSSFDTHFVTLRPVGADVQILFGVLGDVMSISDNAVATGDAADPEALTVNAESGATVKDGEERSFRLAGENQLAVVAKGSGFLELWRSSHDPEAA